MREWQKSFFVSKFIFIHPMHYLYSSVCLCMILSVFLKLLRHNAFKIELTSCYLFQIFEKNTRSSKWFGNRPQGLTECYQPDYLGLVYLGDMYFLLFFIDLFQKVFNSYLSDIDKRHMSFYHIF